MAKKNIVSYDKAAQLAKTREIHGDDAYKKWGSKGGESNRKNLTSEHQRKAANARWKKYREEQDKNEKGD